MKILTIGNSASLDACHLLNLVAGTEGFDGELYIGTLYHSGCRLSRHVENLRLDRADYSLHISSSLTPHLPLSKTPEVTLLQGLRFADWDVIVLQGSTATNYKEETFTNGDLQVLQRFVNENKRNPDAFFVWHMYCANAADEVLQTKWEIQTGYSADVNNYKKIYQQFATREDVFAAITGNVKTYILPDETIRGLIPSGTAVENALTSYLTEWDIHRDYFHLSDFSRVIASYVWYCTLAKVDHLEEIKLDTIPVDFLKSTEDKTRDRALSETEKAIILEAVNNALENPLQVTQSQYTQAPV